MKRKLKLTKLTIANLDHVKGGFPVYECACPYNDPNLGLMNYNGNHSISACAPLCPWDKI